MVRNYTKKTTRQLSSPRKIRNGLDMIRKGYSLRIAAAECGVNYSRLFRAHKATKQKETLNDIPNEDLKTTFQTRSVFPQFVEASIVEYCQEMAVIGYGLSVDMVREVAYDTAVLNQEKVPSIKIPPSWIESKKAGIDWFQGFMKRNPQLSIRTPEGCSLARAAAFNQHTVNVFFDKLEECFQRNPAFADCSRVGNLDETSNSTVQNIRKIVSPKGMKQVHKIKTAERGVTVTTCCTVLAHGSVLPPVMIFPRKKFVSALTLNAFPGTLGLANEKGYMTKETFVLVLKHVIKHTAATKENPFLLLVDNVETHLSVEALNVAKDHGITLLTFPPHCTHRLQPLDLSLFGPFKTFYDAAINSWILQNPGQSITIYHIAGFVKTALCKAGTVENITAGFASAGIMPFDRHIFKETDFVMSSVTQKPAPLNPNSVVEVLAVVPASGQSTSTTPASESAVQDLITPTTPVIVQPEIVTTDKLPVKVTDSSSSFRSPRDFRGLPKAKEVVPKRKPRRKGKCCIATDTPEKSEIEERQRERDEKKTAAEERKRKNAEKKKLNEEAKPAQKSKKRKAKKSQVKRVLEYSEESDEVDGDLEIENKNRPSNKMTGLPFLTNIPTEGDYVLVLFTSRSNMYFVGKIIKDIDSDGDFEISYLRQSSKKKDRFALPNVPDLCCVNKNDIKAILPRPTSHNGSTKRQQSLMEFDFDFGDLKLG